MRINKFLALNLNISRREADKYIEKKEINNNRFYKLSIGPYYRKEYVIKLQETINFIGIQDTKIVKNEN